MSYAIALRRPGLGACPSGTIDVGWGCAEETRPYTGSSLSPTWLPEGTPAGAQYGPSVPYTGQQAGVTLDAAVRAALASQGINVACREECDPNCLAAGMDPCCSTLCDVGDGAGYSRSAALINANPGVLLVERGAKVPVFRAGAATTASAALTREPEAPRLVAQDLQAWRREPAFPPGHRHAAAPPAGPPLQAHTAAIGHPANTASTGYVQQVFEKLQAPALGSTVPWWAVGLGALGFAALAFGGRR